MESSQVRDHVEGVVYDYRDESIQAKLTVPEAASEEAVALVK